MSGGSLSSAILNRNNPNHPAQNTTTATPGTAVRNNNLLMYNYFQEISHNDDYNFSPDAMAYQAFFQTRFFSAVQISFAKVFLLKRNDEFAIRTDDDVNCSFVIYCHILSQLILSSFMVI